jgi:hypothetical protein
MQVFDQRTTSTVAKRQAELLQAVCDLSRMYANGRMYVNDHEVDPLCYT